MPPKATPVTLTKRGTQKEEGKGIKGAIQGIAKEVKIKMIEDEQIRA